MAWLGCPVFSAHDPVTGVPLPGACLYTLSPGTSWPSGAKTAYLDLAMTQAASNPIIADGNGNFTGAGAGIFLNGAYQLVLTSSDGTTSAYGSTIYWSVPNYQGNGPAGQLTTVSSYASFNAAVTAIGSTPTTLLVSSAQTLSGNVTIPSTLSLLFVQGGSLALAGYSITINSYFQRPGPWQVFTGSGTVIFGAGCLDTTSDPAWFGGGSSGASAASNASVNVISTFPASNATPDVSALGGINGTFKTNNSNATTITNFSNMTAGQKFDVIVTDANTSFGGTIRGLPPSTPQYTTLSFLSDGTYAYCIGPPQAQTPIFRNRLINGEMRIDQRNGGMSQSFTASTSAYCVDRWMVTPSGANITGQQVSGPGQWKNLYDLYGYAGVTQVQMMQRIEANNVIDAVNANAAMTFSVYLLTSANMTVTWQVQYPTAGTDNWATSANYSNGTWTVNSNLTRYFASFIPPPQAANGLAVGISVANLIGGTGLQITGCQLEVGNIATAFERRPDDVEMLRCQRYLPSWRGNSFTSPIFASGQATGSNTALIMLPYMVPARYSGTTPMPVLSNVTDFQYLKANGSTGNIVTAANSGMSSLNSYVLAITTASAALSAGNVIWFTNSNDADYLYITGYEL